jgi:hypothetical protein
MLRRAGMGAGSSGYLDMMLRQTLKRYGRRIAGTWGRVAKKYQKRIANKAVRKYARD